MSKLVEWAIAVWAIGKLAGFVFGALVIAFFVGAFAISRFLDWIDARTRRKRGW
jgi:hypothetical protein